MNLTPHFRHTATLALLLAGFQVIGFASGHALPREQVGDPHTVQRDLRLIEYEAGLPIGWLSFSMESAAGTKNLVAIRCLDEGVRLDLAAHRTEWVSTLYYGLQELGFLFPHPRMQFSPSRQEILEQCGRTFEWRPRVSYRGFHLHTPHPNEWVPGFFGDSPEIGRDTIRWLARNGQNAVEVRLIRTAYPELTPSLNKAIEFAHAFGIHFGVGATFSHIQQKAFHLISPFRAVSGIGDKKNLERRLHELANAFDFDYLIVNMGTTEFTSTEEERTLAWIECSNRIMLEYGRQLFVAIHVSSNQSDERYGNFNFLPRHSDPRVGIFPHTVMFYGLGDESAPVYGRRDFSDTRQLLVEEIQKRPVWYYPETSYFVGMDIDVPLLLTDYLVARSKDYDYVVSQGVNGHMTFTSGQELGYWLFDWSVALYTQERFQGRPLAALELLGEDLDVWNRIVDFQTKHIKDGQLIAAMSSTSPLDELPSFLNHKIHARNLLRKIARDPEMRREELRQLTAAIEEAPPLDGIRNHELRLLLEVTWNRLRHAYYLRRALDFCGSCEEREEWTNRAKDVRERSLHKVAQVAERYQRYPEARLFSENENPTSYGFGYGWPAVTLHFWNREEQMVGLDVWDPLFMNIYNIVEMVM